MIRRTALIAVLLGLIAACGVQGPLYLPEDKPAATPAAQTPPSQPSDAEGEKPAEKTRDPDEGGS